MSDPRSGIYILLLSPGQPAGLVHLGLMAFTTMTQMQWECSQPRMGWTCLWCGLRMAPGLSLVLSLSESVF